MTIEMLKAKIHRAVVTGADIDYEGSISIDKRLLDASGIRVFEKVDVLDITNGARLTTYVIKGEPGEICLNGAAARLVGQGDRVIICSYASMTEEEAAAFSPTILLLDGQNRIQKKSGQAS
jgi:aspartate 1-decarboxylase